MVYIILLVIVDSWCPPALGFSFIISLNIAFSPILSSLFWDSYDQSSKPSHSVLHDSPLFHTFYLPASPCAVFWMIDSDTLVN